MSTIIGISGKIANFLCLTCKTCGTQRVTSKNLHVRHRQIGSAFWKVARHWKFTRLKTARHW